MQVAGEALDAAVAAGGFVVRCHVENAFEFAVSGNSSAEQGAAEGPQAKHVGCRGHRVAAQLLGSRVLRRENPGLRAFSGVLGQLADAEIDQFYLAVMRDHDVRRLDVAMQDQVAVRVADRRANLQQQAHDLARSQRVLLAVRTNVTAFDQLGDQIRRAIPGNAAIEQHRDVGMVHASEQLLLALEAFGATGGQHQQREKFQRAVLLEGDIIALGQEYRGHAASAQLAKQGPVADQPADQRLTGKGRVGPIVTRAASESVDQAIDLFFDGVGVVVIGGRKKLQQLRTDSRRLVETVEALLAGSLGQGQHVAVKGHGPLPLTDILILHHDDP